MFPFVESRFKLVRSNSTTRFFVCVGGMPRIRYAIETADATLPRRELGSPKKSGGAFGVGAATPTLSSAVLVALAAGALEAIDGRLFKLSV